MKSPMTAWWATASPENQQTHQDALLKRFLRTRAVPFTKFYGKMFSENGIDPRDIRSTDDLVKLPFTSKADFANPRDFVIIPDEAAVKKEWRTLLRALTSGSSATKDALERELRPILLTSTTGRSAEPVPFLYTSHDIARLEEGGRRLMQLCQSDPAFKHVNTFPFAPHLAFWQAHYAGTGHNTFMLSTGGGKTIGTEGNIRIINKIDPDAIIAMPTFLYHLLQEGNEAGSQWKNLKRLVLGGEKVPAGMRRKLKELCAQMGSPDVAIMSTYGFTEAKLSFTECLPTNGDQPSGFHVYPDMCFIEIIDPESGDRVPDGTTGEIVLTHLDSRGTIVLRYRTGDLIEKGITREPCPHCGLTCPRLLGKISRVSDFKNLAIDKLKGTLVDFNKLENILDDTEGLGAWQVELKKRNDDPLESDIVLVHAVTMKGDEETLREAIHNRFTESTEFSPNEILFHTWDEMRKLQGVGKELKEQKVKDNRPKS
ncbi:MAG: AMP-binding protein [Akkermansiaceae bacterium]|nr:AMP-binding protein [Akkermansiaceae bacterium]MDP4645826.1 AMP-binding protein [Akkermansiaceae bacterium]MDP4720561.1 AMP-binding protein [Akkermansiaceae bacterium]MDP4779001.1 AMP-binding protein [Akkermansiaceae bacterium]MDP4847995.1 AMP-binding protein [Akkermansiaceae bacterium]